MSLIEPPAVRASGPAFDDAGSGATPVIDASIASLASARADVAAAGEFRPPPWLRNPHIQSIYPSLQLLRPRVLRATSGVVAASQRLVLECDDGVRLLAFQARQHESGRRPAERLAVLLHGWEGSSSSPYVLSLAQHLFDRGYDVVRLNLRDHGDSHDLNAELFHSNRIAEVTSAVRGFSTEPSAQAASPVSLGGNFCLRVAARACAQVSISRASSRSARCSIPRARSPGSSTDGSSIAATSSRSGAVRCAGSATYGRGCMTSRTCCA
jgi:predicted alpha/beta-fold hydrolase